MFLPCQRCGGNRVVHVTAKCQDLFDAELNGNEYHGYNHVSVGLDGPSGGDYVDVRLCLDCGQVQGAFPLPPVAGLEVDFPEDE